MPRPKASAEKRLAALARKRERNRAWNKAHPERMRAAAKRYASAHPEKLRANYVAKRKEKLEYTKANYVANRAKKLEQNKNWNRTHPERGREALRRWRKNNPEKHKAAQKARVLKKKKALRAFLHERQRGRCAICTARLGAKTHIDHILPKILGGSNDRSNLQLTCAPCNWSKGPRHPIVHAQSLGRLL